MALWRVLDLYKRDASRRGQAPAKQLAYLGNLTPKKSFAKNNTNSDLFSEFVLFAYVHDEQKRASFYGESGASVHGAIQRSDKSEIISIWTYKLLTKKLPYSIILINYYIGVFVWK